MNFRQTLTARGAKLSCTTFVPLVPLARMVSNLIPPSSLMNPEICTAQLQGADYTEVAWSSNCPHNRGTEVLGLRPFYTTFVAIWLGSNASTEMAPMA